MGRAGRVAETQNKIIVVILDLFKIIKYHCHRIILVFVICHLSFGLLCHSHGMDTGQVGAFGCAKKITIPLLKYNVA